MPHTFIWLITFFAIAGVITRPFKIPEAVWAVAGALLLLALGLITPATGLAGIAKGGDVYLFLIGMMLLAETARQEELFDWLAAYATKMARGSASRLFLLIYLVGIVVTAFLSNDATAVVLTPAVAAAVQAAKVDKPLPYLYSCAFIANAASFIFPISNPANLVIYGRNLPSLLDWMATYSLPSLVAILATFLVLRFTQRSSLTQPLETSIPIPTLSPGGRLALIGIGCTAVSLLVASAIDVPLGLPTVITGAGTSALVLLRGKKGPWVVIKGVAWSVLPLVGGLFVLVEALNQTGIIELAADLLRRSADQSVVRTAWGSGILTAFSCNLLNNLPAGLITGHVVQASAVSPLVQRATLIGIDLGPNLSVTGSLATILWLVALRRAGQEVSAVAFLKLGLLVMPLPLLCTLGILLLQYLAGH